jgi:hypothetical protein
LCNRRHLLQHLLGSYCHRCRHHRCHWLCHQRLHLRHQLLQHWHVLQLQQLLRLLLPVCLLLHRWAGCLASKR